ncbi:MAG: hypothetical protein GY833_16455 [Aestuariibacter sp.]|nr:hypothetical protein [Aestuariibacter sp.]
MTLLYEKYKRGDNPIVVTAEQHKAFRETCIGNMQITFDDYPRPDTPNRDEAIRDWHRRNSDPNYPNTKYLFYDVMVIEKNESGDKTND